MYMSENIIDRTKEVGQLAGNVVLSSYILNNGRQIIMASMNFINSMISMIMG